MIKHILWDFDGALFDTSPARTYALSKTMAEFGFSVPLNMIDGLVRQSYDRCMDALSQRYKYPPQEIQQKYLSYYDRIPYKNQSLYPGALEVCRWICESGGDNFVITDRDPGVCQQFLDEHGVSSYFNGIFLLPAEDLNAGSDVLACIVDWNRLEPAGTLLVSRQEQLILAGKKAGLKTCLVADSPAMSVADWQVNQYDQLLSLLQNDF